MYIDTLQPMPKVKPHVCTPNLRLPGHPWSWSSNICPTRRTACGSPNWCCLPSFSQVFPDQWNTFRIIHVHILKASWAPRTSVTSKSWHLAFQKSQWRQRTGAEDVDHLIEAARRQQLILVPKVDRCTASFKFWWGKIFFLHNIWFWIHSCFLLNCIFPSSFPFQKQTTLEGTSRKHSTASRSAPALRPVLCSAFSPGKDSSCREPSPKPAASSRPQGLKAREKMPLARWLRFLKNSAILVVKRMINHTDPYSGYCSWILRSILIL